MPETEEYLYTLIPTRIEMITVGPTEEESAVVAQHFAYLKDLTEQGIVLLAGRTLNADETAFGMVVFMANSEKSARKVMEGDPAVQHQVMKAQLYPYRAALVGEAWC